MSQGSLLPGHFCPTLKEVRGSEAARRVQAERQQLALKEPCDVEITTDSEYVLYGKTKWITEWKQRHWWRKHVPLRNADLWIELDELASLHKTAWAWTRGHAGHEDNR